MCCHRKCVEKCSMSSKCQAEVESKIEFQVTKSDEPLLEISKPSTEKDIKRRKSSQFLNLTEALNQGMKRVNSTSNLSILPLGLHFPGNSKSLPPSPHHTPR